MKKILLIDTFNLLHRAYHALPASFRDKNGEPTNAVYGVTSMLISIFNMIKPDYVVAALDGMGPTFRVGNFTAYKAHRAEMEQDLSNQIPKVFEVLESFGIKQVVVEGYEADDVIGTFAHNFGKEDYQVIAISNDRDLWQLVNKNVTIMVPSTGGKVDWLGVQEVKTRMGFEPEKIPDYKGLRGDPSDNIPGVHGIGEVTAKKLICEYGSVEEIYRHIKEIKPDSLKEKLANNAEEAVMSKQLATIVTDVPIDIKIEECAFDEMNKEKVKEVLEKYNFKSLIRRMGLAPSEASGENTTMIPENQTSLF